MADSPASPAAPAPAAPAPAPAGPRGRKNPAPGILERAFTVGALARLEVANSAFSNPFHPRADPRADPLPAARRRRPKAPGAGAPAEAGADAPAGAGAAKGKTQSPKEEKPWDSYDNFRAPHPAPAKAPVGLIKGGLDCLQALAELAAAALAPLAAGTLEVEPTSLDFYAALGDQPPAGVPLSGEFFRLEGGRFLEPSAGRAFFDLVAQACEANRAVLAQVYADHGCSADLARNLPYTPYTELAAVLVVRFVRSLGARAADLALIRRNKLRLGTDFCELLGGAASHSSPSWADGLWSMAAALLGRAAELEAGRPARVVRKKAPAGGPEHTPAPAPAPAPAPGGPDGLAGPASLDPAA